MSFWEPKQIGSNPGPRVGHSIIYCINKLWVIGGTEGGKKSEDSGSGPIDVYSYDTRDGIWIEENMEGSEVPEQRSRHSCIQYKENQILLFGGTGNDPRLWLLDLPTKQWSKIVSKGEAPPGLVGHSMVIVNERDMYLLGGTDGKNVNQKLYKLDLGRMDWNIVVTSGQYPATLGANHTSEVFGNSIFVLVQGAQALEIYIFDTVATSWRLAVYAGEPPCTRFRHATCLVESEIFVFGGSQNGKALNDVHVFDAGLLSWEKHDATIGTPTPRVGHAVTAFGRFVVFYGGHDGTKARDDLLYFDAPLLEWNTVNYPGAKPDPRMGLSSCRGSKDVFFVGGGSSGRTFEDIYTFNIESMVMNHPDAVNEGPPAMVSHAVAYWKTPVSEILVVFGGGDGQTSTNDTYQFDINRSEWKCFSYDPDDDSIEAPAPRVGHSFDNAGGKLVLFGGFRARYKKEKAGYSNELFTYDVKANIWSSPPTSGNPPAPRVAHASCATSSGDLVIFGGGVSGTKMLNDFYVLETSSMTWKSPITLGIKPEARFGHGLAAVGSKLYCFGGSTGNAKNSRVFNDLHYIDMDSYRWIKPRTGGTLPKPRSRMGFCAFGTKLVVFGGGTANETFNDLFVVEVINDIDKSDTAKKWYDDHQLKDLLKGDGKKRRGAEEDTEQETRLAARDLSETLRDVKDFLDRCRLLEYLKNFEKKQIDIDTALLMKDDELVNVGMLNGVHRKRFIESANHYKRLHGLNPDGSLAGKSGLGLYKKRYKLDNGKTEQSIGRPQNGMEVMLGRDIQRKKGVALKFFANYDEFDSEVRTLRTFSNEFCIGMIDFYKDVNGSAHCIVLERGSFTLKELLNTRRLSGCEIRFILERIAQILQYVHSQEYAVCVLDLGSIVMIDGIWKLRRLGNLKKAGMPVSMRYENNFVSPEFGKHILHDTVASLRAEESMDIWNLGLFLYQMFTSEPLFEDSMAGIKTMCKAGSVPIGKAVYDEDARDLLRRLLEKEPARRIRLAKMLRHGFFTGGMPAQKQALMHRFWRNQKDMTNMVKNISQSLEAAHTKKGLVDTIDHVRLQDFQGKYLDVNDDESDEDDTKLYKPSQLQGKKGGKLKKLFRKGHGKAKGESRGIKNIGARLRRRSSAASDTEGEFVEDDDDVSDED